MNERTLNAFALAEKSHRGQQRKYNQAPYLVHPYTVYTILRNITDDEDILIASLLHDTVEDTPITIDTIKQLFGSVVAGYVSELTDDKRPLSEQITSYGARLIKLADALHNISDTNPRNRRYAEYKFNQVAKHIIPTK